MSTEQTSSVRRFTAAGHTRAIVIGLIVLLVVAAGGGVYWYRGPHAVGLRLAAVFTESVGIYPGSDVRILGVPVGAVDSIHPQGRTVLISMHLNRGIALRRDTRAVIMSPSLVSDRYIQLTGVYGGGPKFAQGATIPHGRTATSVEVDQLSQSIIGLTHALGPDGANSKGALSDLLNVSAANLKGNGARLKQTIDHFAKASATLADTKDDLFKTIDNLATFTGTLAHNDRSVRGLNTSLSAVTRVLADDRTAFTAALRQLSAALLTVKNFIQRNRAAISSNVKKLAVITQTLSDERDSLAEALRTAPVAVDNVINAYDPAHGTLDGRADLNELSLWRQAIAAHHTGGH